MSSNFISTISEIVNPACAISTNWADFNSPIFDDCMIYMWYCAWSVYTIGQRYQPKILCHRNSLWAINQKFFVIAILCELSTKNSLSSQFSVGSAHRELADSSWPRAHRDEKVWKNEDFFCLRVVRIEKKENCSRRSRLFFFVFVRYKEWPCFWPYLHLIDP